MLCVVLEQGFPLKPSPSKSHHYKAHTGLSCTGVPKVLTKIRLQPSIENDPRTRILLNNPAP